MKLKFSIRYNTYWGGSLHVHIIYYDSVEQIVDSSDSLMKTDDGSLWTIETAYINSRQHNVASFSYFYAVHDGDDNIIRKEWSLIPRIYSLDLSKDYTFDDSWKDVPLQYHLYSNAYITAVHGKRDEKVEPLRLPLFRRSVVFRVSAPQLKPGQSLAVLGNHPMIGGWSEARFIPMSYCGRYEWVLSINVDGIKLPIEYKYVIIDSKTNALVEWEGGENRTTGTNEIADGQALVLYGEALRVCESLWKAAGVVIPVFSLRSEHSYGVGDFGDLRRLVDWAFETGMKVIQILPVNDTTKMHNWTDSYPYNAISIYAFHPHYIDIEALGSLKDKKLMTSYNRQRQELNALTASDYEAVDRVKMGYLKIFYEENGVQIIKSDKFRHFFEENKEWLEPYAVFCLLRDKYNTARFKDWKDHSVYVKGEIDKICMEGSPYYSELGFTYFLQFVLHQQLLEASCYAREKGVILKGDIPIGISPDSVEAWMEPRLFNLNSQAGAPPDFFSRNGQNWGFPTYNWHEMMKDGCKWWCQRFHNMEQYFDAFRIDHVLGFFRIWEIPLDSVHGLLGHFSPSLPLSVDEIERFGLKFRKELFTEPFINDDVLQKFFGLHADYVREKFLEKKAYGFYSLLPEYDTQVKVRQFFGSKNDENSVWIRDGLYRLISDVLFIEDPQHKDMYHPRITVYSEPVFNILENEDKGAFMSLYNHSYYQRHNIFWKEQALRKLPMLLRETRMLPCAEDLGMLPDCVGAVLDSLRILTLEIQSMPKDSGYEFAHLDENPYRSVATISTHDMSPL